MTQHTTREGWLLALVERLRPWYAEAGHPLPTKIRIACGWPSTRATARRNRTIGECWQPSASADETAEVLISPALADPVVVAATVVHELAHAATVGHGHKGPFKTLARALGLVGRLTATTAGPELTERLGPELAALGPYPHAMLTAKGNRRTAPTYLLKVVCPDCGYTIRTTQKWADRGLPTCPCGIMMELA